MNPPPLDCPACATDIGWTWRTLTTTTDMSDGGLCVIECPSCHEVYTYEALPPEPWLGQKPTWSKNDG